MNQFESFTERVDKLNEFEHEPVSGAPLELRSDLAVVPTESAFAIVYLEIQKASKKWMPWIQNGKAALDRVAITASPPIPKYSLFQ